jgi:hypothetical protein
MANLLDLDVRCAIYPNGNFTALTVYYFTVWQATFIGPIIEYDILRYFQHKCAYICNH